jgi:hypothetical protein
LFSLILQDKQGNVIDFSAKAAPKKSSLQEAAAAGASEAGAKLRQAALEAIEGKGKKVEDTKKVDDVKKEEEVKKETEEKAKKEVEEKAKKEVEEKAKKDTEEKAKKETEEKAKKDAEEKAKKESEVKAKKEADEKAKKEADEKTKKETEEKPKTEAAGAEKKSSLAALLSKAPEPAAEEVSDSGRRMYTKAELLKYVLTSTQHKRTCIAEYISSFFLLFYPTDSKKCLFVWCDRLL